MHSVLHAWDSQVLRKLEHCLRKAQRELEKAMNGPISNESEAKAKEMANLIKLLLEQDEIYWAQRSRANWLQHGDRNTSFFHNYASARRKKNSIKRLKDANNDWVEGTESLKPLILSYFTNLFTSEVQVTNPVVLDKIQPRVDDLMKSYLSLLMLRMLKKQHSVLGISRLQGQMDFMLCSIKNSGMCVVLKLHKRSYRR
jgi:hypothetical protein